MSIFKAYDIRGTVPDQLDAEMARKMGLAYANWLTDTVRKHKGAGASTVRVGLGRDARPSGEELVPAFTEGLVAGGAAVVDFGLTSTPMLYFGVGHLNLDGGVVVTASHNPPQYNGFKLTREEAYPVSYDTGIGEIERRIQKGDLHELPQKGSVEPYELFPAYREFVLSFFQRPTAEEKPLRVAIDTGNGMAGLYAELFQELGIEVVPLFFEIDCTFPNHEANPLKASTLTTLQTTIREKNCAMGFAFDGDADRCVALDETGETVRADLMTALLAREMLKRKPGSPILYDLRSSKIVPETIEAAGGQPVRVRVGHSFAKAVMRETGAVFGGELSGHCYFWEAYKSDSAILTLVEVLNMLRAQGNPPLSSLVKPLRTYHGTGEVNFRVSDKQATLKALEERYGKAPGATLDWLDGITVDVGDWWFNVRPSNTEPLLRLTLEAKHHEMMQEKLTELKPLLGEEDTH